MIGNQFESAPTVVAAETAAEAGLPVELTRGKEQLLLERLTPLVCTKNVQLDLASVERIDAAGLAALIKLYCDACNSGHRFTVSRPRRHVREILSLVGLDRLLLDEEPPAATTSRGMERTAA